MSFNSFYKYLIFFAFLFFPYLSWAIGSVVINEIGWSGTKADDTDEWVELRNNTSASIDLGGWVLKAPSDGRPTITLNGSIAGGSFYLIERTSDNDISDVVGDYTGSFGQYGSLANSGEDLELFDATGAVIDKVYFLSGWPAGTAGPDYISMERIDPMKDGSLVLNWSSNNGQKINGKDAAGNSINGTPKSENSVYVSGSNNISPPLPASSNQESSAISDTSEALNISSQSSPALSDTFKVYAGEDKTVLTGQEIIFSGKVTDLKSASIQNADFLWNFGDGSTSRQRVLTHLFSFPGKYIVSLNAFIGDEAHGDYLNVEVIVPKIAFSEVKSDSDGFIELLNETGQKIDAGGFVIKDSLGGFFSIPKGTILEKGALIVFPNAITQIFIKPSDLTLVTSNGKIIDQAHFEGVAGDSQSFVREGEKFLISLSPSPGVVNPKAISATSPVGVMARSERDPSLRSGQAPQSFENNKTGIASLSTVTRNDEKKVVKDPVDVGMEKIIENKDALSASSSVLAEQTSPISSEKVALAAETKQDLHIFKSSQIFLWASVFIGILGAAGFILIKRF